MDAIILLVIPGRGSFTLSAAASVMGGLLGFYRPWASRLVRSFMLLRTRTPIREVYWRDLHDLSRPSCVLRSSATDVQHAIADQRRLRNIFGQACSSGGALIALGLASVFSGATSK
jgi:hypothetical protein